jgi:hypothetical protein
MADEEFMFGDLFATVRVQDLPASREVVAVERQENGTWRVCGSAIANTDGIAELGIEGSKTSRVYAFAIDHWGEPFTPNRTVAYGDIIRPSVFLGWLYRVTAPGALPGEEPVWWNSTPCMPRPVGSAMAQAEMYFQPIAHGPVDIEWEEKGVGDPHWDKVVSLLHFDGDLTDETGMVWINSGVTTDNTNSLYNDYGVFSGSSKMTTTIPALGTNDFTIEAWLNRDANTDYRCIFDSRASSPKSKNGLAIYTSSTLTDNVPAIWEDTQILKGSSKITASEWVHIAIVRESGILYCYVNGSLIGFGSFTSDLTNTTAIIGGTYENTQFYRGHMDELRITKGVARYTENFTPPTEPFPNFK